MQLTLRAFTLPLRHAFTISRGTTTQQPTLIVELSDGRHHGYGEATTNTYYGVTLASMTASLERARPLVESHDPDCPEQLWEAVEDVLGGDPFARSALDQAAHDLWGKRRGRPVYQLWGFSTPDRPLTSFTIGIDRIDVMVAKMREMPDWPIYKIKLGTDDDVRIVRALREVTDAVFRVDANCAWTAAETLDRAETMRELGVELIEQPLPADQWEAMRTVREASALPVIADESCVGPDDIPRCAEAFHGVNVKLVKCGGLTPARRMLEQARALGLKTMVGCMTESSVGISAAAQLLPMLDYADLDGALLLDRDIARGVRFQQGKAVYPDVPGCGVTMEGPPAKR